MNLELFIQACSTVLARRGFDSPAGSSYQCTVVVSIVLAAAHHLGALYRFKHMIGQVGPVFHSVLLADHSQLIDFTYRQFDPNSTFPFRIKSKKAFTVYGALHPALFSPLDMIQSIMSTQTYAFMANEIVNEYEVLTGK